MRTLLLWLTVSRPVLYPLMPLLTILGYQSVAGSLAGAPAALWIVLALLTWPLCVVVYGLNDLYDTASDQYNIYRQRVVGEQVDIPQHKSVRAAVSTGVSIILFSVFVVPLTVWSMLVVLTVAAFCYSVPPVRLKERIVIDALFSGVMYVVFPFLIGTLLASEPVLPLHIIILAVFASLCHLLAAARDIEADTRAGFQTSAVWLGASRSLEVVFGGSLTLLTVWWLIRPTDYVSMAMIASLAVLAAVVRMVGGYQMIMYIVYLFAVIAFLAGVYKVLV